MHLFKNLLLYFIGLKILSYVLCVSSGFTNELEENNKSTANNLSLSGSLLASSSLHDFQDHRHQANMTGALSPQYTFAKEYKLQGLFSFTRDLEDPSLETEVGNPKISIQYQKKINPYLLFRPSFSGIYALNKTSKLRDFYRGSIFFEPRLTLDLTRVGLENFSVITQLSLGKNFHEYSQNRQGSSNTEFLIIPTFVLSFQFSEKWSLSAAMSRSIGLSYISRSSKHAFALSQEISWQLFEKINLNLAHSNGGIAYKENGIDSNLTLFDENTSMLTTGVTLIL